MAFGRKVFFGGWVALFFTVLIAGVAFSETDLQKVLDSHDPSESTAAAQTTQAAQAVQGQETAGSDVTYPCEGNVNCHIRLNVRNGPWGKIIDGFPPGTKVQIVAREGKWYRIRYKSGFAYVHVSLVDAPGVPAYDGPNPSPYDPPGSTPVPPTPTPGFDPVPPGKTGGINGPEIPEALKKGLELAKRSEWNRSGKCLQFSGTVAAKAGAKPGKAVYYQPQSAYPADTRLRGAQINDLPKAVEAGLLKPGMLIHVKIHYDRDPAYHVANDAHHWFVYMGKNSSGVPMFADNTHQNRLQTADQVYANMKGWSNSREYGDKKYGYVPRVTAIHDPFADQR